MESTRRSVRGPTDMDIECITPKKNSFAKSKNIHMPMELLLKFARYLADDWSSLYAFTLVCRDCAEAGTEVLWSTAGLTELNQVPAGRKQIYADRIKHLVRVTEADGSPAETDVEFPRVRSLCLDFNAASLAADVVDGVEQPERGKLLVSKLAKFMSRMPLLKTLDAHLYLSSDDKTPYILNPTILTPNIEVVQLSEASHWCLLQDLANRRLGSCDSSVYARVRSGLNHVDVTLTNASPEFFAALCTVPDLKTMYLRIDDENLADAVLNKHALSCINQLTELSTLVILGRDRPLRKKVFAVDESDWINLFCNLKKLWGFSLQAELDVLPLRERVDPFERCDDQPQSAAMLDLGNDFEEIFQDGDEEDSDDDDQDVFQADSQDGSKQQH
ncbi:hypothetical protein K470DRAFT_258227 [Piedraia hortae CBS 480.64]|uniref:Uncharacterized protein n=1 Tax=Piedraia hortae CBS 480.64 TaxID=1314780 RepID=A0A6A7BXV1_9PEZI|nr:hypothetical protein K470DRAFT_258227 [Piedraia hortae CBS 480.64]